LKRTLCDFQRGVNREISPDVRKFASAIEAGNGEGVKGMKKHRHCRLAAIRRIFIVFTEDIEELT